MSKSANLSLILISYLLGAFIASFVFPLVIIKSINIGYWLMSLSIPVAIFLIFKNKLLELLAVALLFIMLGLISYYYSLPIKDSHQISCYNGDKVTIEGWVCASPQHLVDKNRYQICPLEIDRQGEKNNNIEGKILLSLSVDQDQFKYQNIIKFQSKLSQPKNYPDFSYQAYLANQKIYSVSYPNKIDLIDDTYRSNNRLTNIYLLIISLIYNLKDKLLDVSSRLFNQPYQALFDGLLFGQTSGLDDNLKEAFTNSGLIHIVVVSGFNITILLMVFFKTIKNFSINLAFWLGTISIIFFVVMVGASPPAVRAGIMGWIVLFGLTRGRQADRLNLILLPAVIMSLFNPMIVRYDLGFQLSFLAIIGLFYFSPVLEKYLEKSIIKYYLNPTIKIILIETLSAQLLTFPLILYTFSRVSLIAPLANLLVLPLIPYLMFVGLGIIGLGLIWFEIAKLAGFLYELLLRYIIEVAQITGSISWGHLEFKWFNTYLLILSYIIILAIIVKNGSEIKKKTV